MRGLLVSAVFSFALSTTATLAGDATRPWVEYFGVNYEHGSYDGFPAVRLPSPHFGQHAEMDSGYQRYMRGILGHVDDELAKGKLVIYTFRGFGQIYDETKNFLRAVDPDKCSTKNWYASACDGARDFRAWIKDQVTAVKKLPHYDPTQLYWQLGNEINNSDVSTAVREYYGMKAIKGSVGSTHIIDGEINRPYIESYFAPLVDEIVKIEPNARLVLGSAATAYREETVPWMKDLLQTTVAGDQQVPGDKLVTGEKIVSLIRNVSAHYVAKGSNRPGIGTGDAVGLLDEYWNVIQGRGIFVTEEVGESASNYGRGGEALVRSIGTYLAFQQEHNLSPDELCVTFFAWKTYSPSKATNPLTVAELLRDIFQGPGGGGDPVLSSQPVKVTAISASDKTGLHAYAFHPDDKGDKRIFVFVFADIGGLSTDVDDFTLQFAGEAFGKEQDIRFHYFSEDGNFETGASVTGNDSSLKIPYGYLRRKVGTMSKVVSDAVLLEILN